MEPPIEKQSLPVSNTLEVLRKHSTIVADTGDFKEIEQFKPTDSTTNPSLILQASKKPEYQSLIKESIIKAKNDYKVDKKSKLPVEKQLLPYIINQIIVNFGVEILKLIPGLVSTEVDARYSFDKTKTVSLAKQIITMYEAQGVKRDRVLIKIAATYEGIQAAKELKKSKINCNLTLIFGLCQGILCAQNDIYLISPFCGRILDWYKKNHSQDDHSGQNDPGVKSIKQIFRYYKKFNHKTIIMGASFRNKEEIMALCGCDKLTISPSLLKELMNCDVDNLSTIDVSNLDEIEQMKLDEKSFRWELNQDTMATEKLSEGIRKFSEDIVKLEDLVQTILQQTSDQ